MVSSLAPEIGERSLKSLNCIAELSKSHVAIATEIAAKRAGRVVMIHIQMSVVFSTQLAEPILGRGRRINAEHKAFSLTVKTPHCFSHDFALVLNCHFKPLWFWSYRISNTPSCSRFSA
jgi:hypothetical protein